MEGYRQYSDGRVQFQPSRNTERRRALQDAVRRDRLIPLADLLDNSPQVFLSQSKGRLLTYYAQVWALTRFLADGEDGKHRDQLRELLTDAAAGRMLQRMLAHPLAGDVESRQAILDGRTGPWAALAYFTDDISELEREYFDYVSQLSASDWGRGRRRGRSHR
jgi:hypothetical protein